MAFHIFRASVESALSFYKQEPHDYQLMFHQIKKYFRKNQDSIKMEPSPLERIITTPGLQHIALHIFGNTQAKDLFKCKKVNKNWKDSVEKMWVYYLKTLPAFKKRQAKLRWRRAINRTITKIRKAKGGHIWFESNLVNFEIPEGLKTVLSSPE